MFSCILHHTEMTRHYSIVVFRKARSSFIVSLPAQWRWALHKRRWPGLVILLLTKPRHPEILVSPTLQVSGRQVRAGQGWWDLWREFTPDSRGEVLAETGPWHWHWPPGWAGSKWFRRPGRGHCLHRVYLPPGPGLHNTGFPERNHVRCKTCLCCSSRRHFDEHVLSKLFLT